MANKKSFVTISNKEIYNEIQKHNAKVDEIIDLLHTRITKVEEKVPLFSKLIFGGFSFSIAILGFLIWHLVK